MPSRWTSFRTIPPTRWSVRRNRSLSQINRAGFVKFESFDSPGQVDRSDPVWHHLDRLDYMSSCRKSCASMSVWDKRINPVISAESLDMTGFWRRVWDSNPRGLSPKLISNQPRYDHFDNPPCISVYILFWKKARQHARTI